MGLEILDGLARLYAEFRGRYPDYDERKKNRVSIELDKTRGLGVVRSGMETVVDGYNEICKGAPRNRISTDGYHEKKPFWATKISAEPIISIAARKTFETFPEPWLEHAAGDEVERIWFDLFRGVRS